MSWQNGGAGGPGFRGCGWGGHWRLLPAGGDCGDSLLPGTVLPLAPASGARRWAGRQRCLLAPGAVVGLCLGSAPWWEHVATGPQALLGPEKTGRARALGIRLLWEAALDPEGQSCLLRGPEPTQTRVRRLNRAPPGASGAAPPPARPESLRTSHSSLCQGQDLALVGAFGASGWQAHLSWFW